MPGVGGSFVQVVGNLPLGRFPLLRKRNTHNQAGNPSVAGNESPGNFLGAERDIHDSFYIGIAQGSGVLDKRFDNQFVFKPLAVRIV